MRIRTTVAVVSGALALSALAIPASQASQASPSRGDFPVSDRYGFPAEQRAALPKAGQRSLAAKAAVPVVSKIVINGGKPIVVGTTNSKKVTISVTASDDSGIDGFSTIIWRGTSPEDPIWAFYQNEESATCKASTATTSTCSLTVTVPSEQLINEDATTWKVGAWVTSKDGEDTKIDASGTVKIQRASKLTVDAAPEPVKKNGTVTITGKLSRANWDTGLYAGYSTQSVILQFRKPTTTAYTNVKGVKTSTTGALKTTNKATVDGYYRWSFVGTATTPAINVAGDYVDVK
ncbi:DUF5707 domain-containing protein [Streptomyces sp. NPDC006638]|uniref:DUF5707 domain-containing protein n=1 Tax=Streptomyces sp. NPDC006638 TaxID=3157183 RepID=UPI0033A91892